jgi:hypothetical protein
MHQRTKSTTTRTLDVNATEGGTNGSLKLEGAGAGVLLISPMGEQLKYVL